MIESLIDDDAPTPPPIQPQTQLQQQICHGTCSFIIPCNKQAWSKQEMMGFLHTVPKTCSSNNDILSNKKMEEASGQQGLRINGKQATEIGQRLVPSLPPIHRRCTYIWARMNRGECGICKKCSPSSSMRPCRGEKINRNDIILCMLAPICILLHYDSILVYGWHRCCVLLGRIT